MKNLLLALALGVAVGVLGGVVGGEVLAGILPGLLAAGIAYFLLARRTGKKLEALVNEVQALFASMQGVTPPRTPGEAAALQKRQEALIEQAREVLRRGLPLAREQFLIAEQIYAQLGTLDYLERKYGAARDNLDKAWSRNWQAKAMIACIDHRERKRAEAVTRMAALTGPGGSDPLFWALYAWLALEANQREVALQALAQGIKQHDKSAALRQMSDDVANKRPVKMAAFAPGWYQFFPEQTPEVRAAQRESVEAQIAAQSGAASPKRRGPPAAHR